ncbi:hypothetical protein [Streptomyces sp. WL006]|uniref:hypothetical protein n=1 Tax=Streptomyces sp. WL006 TaxID=3423915 RepID=UPI003F6C8F72
MSKQKSFRVPAGRVVGLSDLRARMATANDLAYDLTVTSDTADFKQVMEALHEAYWIAAALASASSRTGCTEHPQGPVDPVAPDGWSKCLLCNNRRRSGRTEPVKLTGRYLTGATADVNRPRERVEAARQPADPGRAAWREPEGAHPAPLDSPVLAHRRATADHTHAAALARARAERTAPTTTL